MKAKKKATPRSGPGRRPGDTSSRQTVLEAARSRFARDGFNGTTIRNIALDAAVDPSQVMQFFGSKDALFAAVMALPAVTLKRLDTAFQGPDEHLGERVVRAYLEAWEGAAEESQPLMAMLRGAIVNEQASAQLRQFIQSRLVHGTKGRGDGALLRAGLAAAMLIGVIVSRRIIGVPALARADAERLIATVGPAIQQVLVGTGSKVAAPLPGPATREKRT